jgi:predicted TIM-barrel enzyme
MQNVSSRKMLKSLSALAIFFVLGAAVIAVPGFAPAVEAGEGIVLAKADRLAVHTAALDCAAQVWPDLAASCLKNPGSGAKILQARLVTARR